MLNPQIWLDIKDFFGNDNPDFVLFFNSRNIRRKQIPDAMLAFRAFLDSLPKEKADKCKIVLHTEEVSDHGTDLRKVKEYFFDESYPNAVKFSTQKLSSIQLNYLYKPSTGELTAPAHISSNGININSATVSTSYTIASGNNGFSVGPITVASGISVSVASGQRWLIL